ncbi:hypothetical protein HYU17_05930 [Candidatus Woesearchaeota archaeon]|nr:hypothetical protein [Candidatus Woesearchaeota archaeon]
MAKAKSKSGKASGESRTAEGKGFTLVRKGVYKTPNTTKLEITVKKLGTAPDDKKFVLKDGRLLKDMVELANALEYMSDDVFSHHVNNFKNDFKTWVEDVFSEKELAAEMHKAKTKADMQLALLRHIVKKTF